ncbi:M48 family metalloprotease [Pyrococcus kukulkanii]|uniref:M48 family metallopeptidase n=1 Tax=Pyrococcus kukulkanii TaxID=1609559 RepID=UPI00356B13F8
MLYWIFLLQVIITVITFKKMGLFLSLGVLTWLYLMYRLSLRLKLPKDRYSKITWEDMPWLYDGIARMANRARIPMPTIYIEDSPIPTAYSFKNSIVLSAGLFEVLSEDEILAVAAHEIGHIKNGDTVLFPISRYGQYGIGVLSGAVLLFGYSFHVKLISLTTFVAYSLYLHKFLRKREFRADNVAIRIAEVPYALKNALEELKYYETMVNSKDIPLPTIQPQIDRKKDEKLNITTLLISTHPTYEERIARIMAIVDMYRIFEFS